MIVGFDPDFEPAIANAAVAAYARSPVPELPVSASTPICAAARSTPGQWQSRRAWKIQAMWLPRASVAYQVNEGWC